MNATEISNPRQYLASSRNLTRSLQVSVLCLFCAALFVSRLQAAEIIDDLFNTGLDSGGALLADGVDDPHYGIISGPDAGPWLDIVGVGSGTWVDSGHTDSNSKWLRTSSTIGTFAYRTTFTLPLGANLSTVNTSGRWASDNNTEDILINGISTGYVTGFGDFTFYTPFSLDTGFVVGTNTIDFLVFEGGVVTGLRVDDLVGSYELVPEPATAVLAGCGLLFIGLSAIRR